MPYFLHIISVLFLAFLTFLLVIGREIIMISLTNFDTCNLGIVHLLVALYDAFKGPVGRDFYH